MPAESSGSVPSAEWIELMLCDDPRDAIHRAVACLVQGGVVGLPSETCYLLAASALNPSAVSRLAQARQGGSPRPLSLALKSADEASDWLPQMGEPGRRLMSRLWPGPVQFVCELPAGGQPGERGLLSGLSAQTQAHLLTDGCLSVCSPSYDLLREMFQLVPGPLVLTTAGSADQPAGSATAECLRDRPGIDMVLDDGVGAADEPTQVRIAGSDWRVIQSGSVSTDEVTRAAGSILMFVCTGNTCRSPMAEALCKRMLAERAGCAPAELEASGYVVLSAGLSAIPGSRAASEAVETVRDMGASLETHASRILTPSLVMQSDWLIAMTRDHQDAILAVNPEVADRVLLLDPRGGDVADPYGSSREMYRKTARLIESYIGSLLDRIGYPKNPA